MTDLVTALRGHGEKPTDALEKALLHWLDISVQLHDLFKRAPTEAVTDPELALARMALKAIEKDDYPPDAVEIVRARANARIAALVAQDRERIRAALADSRLLLQRLDEFVASMHRPREPVMPWDAEVQVRQFLDDCRKFDRALSAIPAKLREGVPP